MSEPLVSIVVPAYNAATTLEVCLKACLDQTYPDTEVIVVDDGSIDDTEAIARSLPVRYECQENAGPAVARNRGAAVAKGEYVVFTDSDCVPHRDWIEELVAPFDAGVVGVGGTYGIANPDTRLARMVHEEIVYRHGRFGDEVDFLGSFNVAYRRDVFNEVGGFDESFRYASGEDNELAYRLHAAGGKLRFAPKAVVDHHHPERLAPYLRTQARHGFWRMKLYALHPGKMSGDRYAGSTDLFGPPLAVVCLFGVLCAAITAARGDTALAAWASVALLCGYVAFQLPLALALMSQSGRKEMLLFAGLLALRDGARAWGMVRGIWHFLILKRVTV